MACKMDTVVFGLILLEIIKANYACVCVVTPGTNHIQTDLCNAELSYIGIVIDAVPSRFTSVRVIKNIKGPYKPGQIIPNISPGWVGTSCYPWLRPSEEEYLFTAASAESGVGECDLVTNMSDLTQEQLVYLMFCKRRRYINNCHCQIIDNPSKASSYTCVTPVYYEQKSYLNKYGMCLQSKGRCGWYTTGKHGS